MRTFPAPLSVTFPPPSMTTGPVLLKTFAVAVRVIVAGAAPQLNVITPPFATAATNASEVQLSGVPVPMTVFGFAMLSACASGGTTHLPFGLPAAGPVSGLVGGGEGAAGSPLLLVL